MTQQLINVGASPNDGSGDPLRTAGTKINDNFTELYVTISAGTNEINAVNVFAQSGYNEANAAFNRANAAFHFRTATLIVANTFAVSNTTDILLCDPNAVGSNIVINLSPNFSDGKTYTIKNINPGGYSVNVTATSNFLENPATKAFVSSLVMANTGEVYTWVVQGGVYRYIG